MTAWRKALRVLSDGSDAVAVTDRRSGKRYWLVTDEALTDLLGDERSVCLRDILDAPTAAYHPQNPVPHHPADFIRGKFGV